MSHPSPTPHQALISAVAKGDLSKAAASLQQGANPNLPDDLGQLPVLIAMKQKDRSMLALLMKSNANLRAMTQDNLYPMALAAIMGDNEAIKVMSAHCADFESPLEGEPSALEHAFIAGKINTAQELIRHGADTECVGVDGEPMISRLAAMGNEAAVKILIKENALALTEDMHGIDAIEYAKRGGNKNLMRLIAVQAQSQKKQSKSKNWFVAGRKRKKTHATEQFIKNLEEGNLEKAHELLREEEINVNAKNRNGVPLVILVARTCKNGTTTAVQDAAQPSMAQGMIEKLVEKGAHALEIDTVTGNNLLHELVHQRQEAMAIHFMAIGIVNDGINRSDRQLNRPLHLASRAGLKQFCMALMQKGADINAVNRRGETPLHVCAMHLNVAIAEILIGKGANRNLKTRSGQTIQSLLNTVNKDAQLFSVMLEARTSIESAMSIFSANNPMANLARAGLGLPKTPKKPNTK